MEHEDSLNTTFKAAADLSASQYCAMIFTAAKTVGVATAVTDHVIGILQNTPSAAGQAAEVCFGGRTKAKVGGNVSAGTLLGPDTDAMLIAVTADTKRFCGVALESGVDGDVVDVILFPYSQLSSAVGA